MGLRRQQLVLTTNAAGAGTVVTDAPINGYVKEIRQDSANWNFGGSVDYVFTRAANEGGGTVVALTNKSGPFTAYVGGSVEAGGPSAAFWGVPCDGYLTMVVSSAGSVIAGTVHVYYDI